MPERTLIARELGQMLGVLSHPHRLRLVLELRDEERDVNSLQGLLGIPHAGVSQHLALLRAHRVVAERRAGRHVYYHLCQPELANWLVAGFRFLEGEVREREEVASAVRRLREQWQEPLAAG